MKRWKLLILAGVVLIVSALAFAQYATSNYIEQGGARTVIGGSLDVVSGGDLDVESGGSLKIAGTAITPTAAQFNFLSGVTAGTAAASKAVVLGSGRAITTLGAVTADGVLTVNNNVVATGTLTVTGTSTLTGGLTANTVTSFAGQDEVRTMAFNFFDPDVAASQSAAVWGLDPGTSVGGADFVGVVMPWAGSVIGIAAYSNDACTSGSLTADATINGTATGLQAVINTTDTQTKYTSQANDADAFTAGQRIGVKVTTTSAWLPTTADVIVTVFVEY